MAMAMPARRPRAWTEPPSASGAPPPVMSARTWVDGPSPPRVVTVARRSDPSAFRAPTTSCRAPVPNGGPLSTALVPWAVPAPTRARAVVTSPPTPS